VSKAYAHIPIITHRISYVKERLGYIGIRVGISLLFTRTPFHFLYDSLCIL